MEDAQSEYDTLDVWCEAWKQKSFSLREYVSIEEDERFTSDSISKKGNFQNRNTGGARDSIDRVRKIIENRKSVSRS